MDAKLVLMTHLYQKKKSKIMVFLEILNIMKIVPVPSVINSVIVPNALLRTKVSISTSFLIFLLYLLYLINWPLV